MFDALRFAQDHRLAASHGSDPWIQVACPWCGSQSSKGGEKLYGGINTVTEAFNCWRCGSHSLISLMWAVGVKDPKATIWEYRHGFTDGATGGRSHAQELALPECGPMVWAHRNYLRGRGFDPDELAMLYGLKGTGQGCLFATKSRPEPINLAWRILIPMRNEKGYTVSWQARDITGRSKLRYIGCPDVDALASYKTMLYGAEFARRDVVGVVEGVVDMWRMGPGFVATLGTGVTPEQVKQLAQWGRVVVCFDSEPQAQRHAREIAGNLASLGVRCDIVDLELGSRDPGDLTPQEAGEMRRELGF